MSTPFLTVVTAAHPGDGERIPRWAGGGDAHREPADGSVDTIPIPAFAAGQLDSGVQIETRMTDLSGRLHITDSRTVLVFRRFEDKGGGWWGMGGGAVVAALFNLVSKARVAARGAGKAAVGQVRHERLAFVGWRSKPTGAAADELRLGFHRPGESIGVLDLRIPSDLDPALLAVEITRRAARHRLRHGADDPGLRALADTVTPAAASGGFAVLRFPVSPAPGAAPAADGVHG